MLLQALLLEQAQAPLLMPGAHRTSGRTPRLHLLPRHTSHKTPWTHLRAANCSIGRVIYQKRGGAASRIGTAAAIHKNAAKFLRLVSKAVFLQAGASWLAWF
jgi:hypothetical protein